MPEHEELEYGERIARNVMLITIGLATFKYLLYLYTGSISILADSYHSFSDIVPIAGAWIGLKIAQRGRNKRFPYGYYKAENMAAFIASIFIFLLGYDILVESIERLRTSSTLSHTLAGFTLTVALIFVSFFLYIYLRNAARRTGSQALLANARETKMDIFSSVLVVLGFSMSAIGHAWVGGAVGIVFAVLVFYSGFGSMKDAVLSLMDAGVSEGELERIRKVALSVPRVKEVRDIRARRSGPFVMVEIKIAVPASMNVNQAHAIASEVENALSSLKEVDHAMVHVEPPSRDSYLVAVPVDEHGNPASVFGGAPFFDLFYEGKGRNHVERVLNPGANEEKKRGVKAALYLIDRGVDEVRVKKIGEDSRKILEDAGISVKFDFTFEQNI